MKRAGWQRPCRHRTVSSCFLAAVSLSLVRQLKACPDISKQRSQRRSCRRGSSWKGAGSSLAFSKEILNVGSVALNCSSLLFPFSCRSCCQCCFSGELPAGLHDGLGRVLQTAGRLLRADTRAGSGPQPGLYSCSLTPIALSPGESGLALPWGRSFGFAR